MTAMSSSPLLTYVFPSIGCVLSLVTFSSSFSAVLQVRRAKRLGELNPVPYAGILGQTSGQFFNGSAIKNWFIFWGKCSRADYRFLADSLHNYLRDSRVQDVMTTCVLLIAGYYSTIALITAHLDASHGTKETIWGTAGAFSLVAYYSAPLSTLLKVVRKRDSSSLHPPLCFMHFANVCLWLSYGVAIKNRFIWVPESVGGVLSTSALVLLFAFPRRERMGSRPDTAEEGTQESAREGHAMASFRTAPPAAAGA